MWKCPLRVVLKHLPRGVVVTIPLRLTEVNKWGKTSNRKIQPGTISCVVQCGKENISPKVRLWLRQNSSSAAS